MIIIKYKKKKPIIQMQIDDYIDKPVKHVYDANIPKQRIEGLNLLHSVPPRKKKKRGRKKNILKSFYKIDYFLTKGNLTPISPAYLRRFNSVNVLPETEVHFEQISQIEIIVLKCLSGFTGFLEYLIYCNNFTYFDEIQLKLENEGITFRNKFLYDIIIYELTRIQIGIDNYTSFMNAIRFMQPLVLKNILHDPDYFPDADAVSHVLRALPLKDLKDFFYLILDELYDKKVVCNRILVWDCQFIHSNSSDNFNEEKGSYNDPDAGFCKHNGKIYGVGYKASTIYAYCGDRYIPIYCELFPGNQDEYSVFQTTFKHYFSMGYEKPLIVLSDAGPYSLKNLLFFFNMGIIPLINGRKNIKNHRIRKLNKNYYINLDFVPSNWSCDDLILFMNIRAGIERQFSHNIIIYRARRANVRGIEMVSKHRFMILILDILKINTAYNIGRPDLIGKCNIFNMTRQIDFDAIFPHLAQKEGYQIFLPEFGMSRQK